MITGAAVASTICTRPARYAWKWEMLPAATRSPKRARSTLHVLEAVEQRDDDAVGDGVRVDALDGVLERGRLDRHEQEADRLRELLDHLDARARASLPATRRRARRAR